MTAASAIEHVFAAIGLAFVLTVAIGVLVDARCR